MHQISIMNVVGIAGSRWVRQVAREDLIIVFPLPFRSMHMCSDIRGGGVHNGTKNRKRVNGAQGGSNFVAICQVPW